MSSQSTSDVGTVFANRYLIEELVGRGGMSVVYRATDQSLGRPVALKVFRDLDEGSVDMRRQSAEIRLLATLNHPNLVTLFDGVTEEDRVFLVMEYVDGDDLLARIGGGLPLPVVARIGADVADALAYIHARGVVHRDVKPGNVLVPRRGEGDGGPYAKLTDFGIAKITEAGRDTTAGSVLGTASYLSPEQALGRPVSPATDVYSLGLVLLECITGERAFPGSALESAAARLLRSPDIPAHLPAQWRSLLTAMTMKEAGQRPSAHEVAVRMRELAAPAPAAEDTAQTAPPTRRLPAVVEGEEGAGVEPPHGGAQAAGDPSPASGVHRPRRRWPWLWLPAVVALLAAVALAVALQAGPADQPAYPAVGGQLGEHLQQLQESVRP